MKKQALKNKSELSIFISSIFPSLALLRKNDPLRMAGATAFFTTFALPPIVFILAQLFGFVTSPKVVGLGLIQNISNNLGTEGAQQVRQVIKSIRGFSNSWIVIVLGFLFLLFVSTTLFIVIRNSLDQIWQITVKKSPGFAFNLFARLRSFAVIFLVGLLFFANLFFNSIEALGVDYLAGFSQSGGRYFEFIFSEISSVVIVAVWFILLFRFLADGRPKWKAACIGGLLTGLLFTAGRFVLRALLINSNIGKLYGPSGSFVLVLLFVFYTSFMMYYGACFIAVYSQKKHWPLKHNQESYVSKSVEAIGMENR